MKIQNITTFDMNNGDGLRTVLWVSGCTHCCKECQNPCTWDINDGVPFDEDAKKELFDDLSDDSIQGITFSGGDPLHPNNKDEVGKIIKEIKSKYPNKDIWLYTGFEFKEVLNMNLSYLSDIDVIVDGPFQVMNKDLTLKWRGSSNQNVIDVKKSLAKNKTVLFCD